MKAEDAQTHLPFGKVQIAHSNPGTTPPSLLPDSQAIIVPARLVFTLICAPDVGAASRLVLIYFPFLRPGAKGRRCFKETAAAIVVVLLAPHPPRRTARGINKGWQENSRRAAKMHLLYFGIAWRNAPFAVRRSLLRSSPRGEGDYCGDKCTVVRVCVSHTHRRTPPRIAKFVPSANRPCMYHACPVSRFARLFSPSRFTSPPPPPHPQPRDFIAEISFASCEDWTFFRNSLGTLCVLNVHLICRCKEEKGKREREKVDSCEHL